MVESLRTFTVSQVQTLPWVKLELYSSFTQIDFMFVDYKGYKLALNKDRSSLEGANFCRLLQLLNKLFFSNFFLIFVSLPGGDSLRAGSCN